MTLVPHALTTLERVVTMIPGMKLTGEDRQALEILINNTSSLFERYTRRRLAKRQYMPSGATPNTNQVNLLLHGNDRLDAWNFQLPEYPVTDVSAIVIKYPDLADATKITLVQGEDWVFTYEGKITLIDGDNWLRGINNLEITWDAGYVVGDNSPESLALEQAMITQLKYDWYALKRPSEGVSSVTDVGGTINYADRPLVNQARMILDGFRRNELVAV